METTNSGKRYHRRGAETRTLILQVAERLFAERGLDGVSLRDVTREANVDLGLVNYHFKSKNGLFETIIAQRNEEIWTDRSAMLEALPEVPPLASVVEAFLRPLLNRLRSGDPGWRYYAALASQVHNQQRYSEFRHHMLEPTAKIIVNTLSRIYPDADERLLYWAYIMMVGGLAQVMSGSDRLYLLSGGTCDINDSEMAFAELHHFCVGGIHSLITAGLPSTIAGETDQP